MTDSHIVVYSEMVSQRKTEESIPYESKKHTGSNKKHTPLLRGMHY